MTESLLLKLEEKMMLLLTEIEDSRREIERLSHENSFLKIERENHSKKLTDLISLLDTINSVDNMMTNVTAFAMKPVLVEG